MAKLTDKQATIVALAKQGVPVSKAIAAAGYSGGTTSKALLGSETLAKAVAKAKLDHERRQMLIKGPMANKALKTMNELMNSGYAASVRKGAAEWVLASAGHGSKAVQAADDVPLHEMTAEQLEAFITRAQAVVEQGGSPPVITVIDPERPV